MDSLQDLNEDEDNESNRPPIFTGQQKKRLPLFVNEDWMPDNKQPLLEDKNRDIAYWAGVEDVQKLVAFVKERAR